MNIDKKLQNKLKAQHIRRELPAYFKGLSDVLSMPVNESIWIDPIQHQDIINDLYGLAGNYRCSWILDRFDDKAADHSAQIIQKALNVILDHEVERECIYTGLRGIEEMGPIYLRMEQAVTHWRGLIDNDSDEFWLKSKSEMKLILIELNYDMVGQYTQNVYRIRVFSNDWYMQIRDILDPAHIGP